VWHPSTHQHIFTELSGAGLVGRRMAKTAKQSRENKEKNEAQVNGVDGIDLDQDVDITDLSSLSQQWKKVWFSFLPLLMALE
jgi:hypothetical protein